MSKTRYLKDKFNKHSNKLDQKLIFNKDNFYQDVIYSLVNLFNNSKKILKLF